MGQHKSNYLSISAQAFRRMPEYYNYLLLLKEQKVEKVSAPMVAKELGLSNVQVRKDFAAVSPSGGTPKTGFDVDELIDSIEKCLGYQNSKDAVLVGVGNLGSALLSYDNFENYGVNIVAAFDRKGKGNERFGKKIFPLEKLPQMCQRMKIRIGIIAVPASAAQEICDMLLEGGILAIWNFAPAHLTVPENVLVQNENMALSLSLLSQHLEETMEDKN